MANSALQATILWSLAPAGAFDGHAVASRRAQPGKVPQVTLGFWLIKILATTLGETGGDAVSMTLHLGYALSTGLFFTAFLALVAVQITRRAFHPPLYWAVIVATTMAGTTMADFADRSLGIGYLGGSTLLFGVLLAVLAAWYLRVGSITADQVGSPRVERFYWAAILASNTLGTALGDYLSDRSGLGYEGGALVFAAGLAVVAGAYGTRRFSASLLFWAAFILTRPLGATVGDLLTKPQDHGGLGLSRITSTAALGALMLAGILLLPQRAGRHPGRG